MSDAGVYFFDIIGLTGAALYLASYVILQIKRRFAKTIFYSFMNMVAAVFVVVSLTQSFNLPSFTIQILWIAISVYGIYRSIKLKNTQLILEEQTAEKQKSGASLTRIGNNVF